MALKHLGVYAVNVGPFGRLHAKRTWTGPLLEALVDVIRAVDPRSCPEQQSKIEKAWRILARKVGKFVTPGFALHEPRDGVAHAEAPSSTTKCRARADQVRCQRFPALASQTQTPAK